MSGAEIARALAGYLCGTKRRPPDLEGLAGAHRGLPRELPDDARPLADGRWTPPPVALSLRGELDGLLDREGLVDLVLYGSQARRSVTGFSDVDAVLVLEDAVAEDPERLRALRPGVLAAQRAVLRYQPMQHHGFDVVTPALLARAGEALSPPEIAFSVAESLLGRAPHASFGGAPDAAARRRQLDDLAGGVLEPRAWPAHPWTAHRLVSMFELVPALFMQARGRDVPKWDSFEEARNELGGGPWAYDDLSVVRERWTRPRRPLLAAVARVTRNPWPAVAAWRRIPARLPSEIAALLTPSLLERLQSDVRRMAVR